LLLALALALVFNILLGVAYAWQELTIYRTISRVVFGLMLILTAISALILPPGRRGTILTVLGSSSMLIMGIPSLFAASLATAPGEYHGVYFSAAIMDRISALYFIHGIPEKVYDEVCRLLNDVKEPGGFIYSGTGIAIPNESKPENVKASIEAVKKCESYN